MNTRSMISKNVVIDFRVVNDKAEILQINYNLRPRNNIYYGEEDGNFEDPKDDDYNPSDYEEDEDDDDEVEYNFDQEDDNDSDYDPDDDADDTDDEEFEFDEEDEDENDEEDNEEEDDEYDKQFISNYLNDPDYDPNEDADQEDANENIVLKAGIAYDNDEEKDEEEDDEEEDKNRILNISKRRFENGKVVYRWVKMTKEEAEKKYDEDYVLEEN